MTFTAFGGRKYPMSGDRIIGDDGNCTVYECPDGSWYALDRSGRGGELPQRTRITGPAKFDPRGKAWADWVGSRSRRA